MTPAWLTDGQQDAISIKIRIKINIKIPGIQLRMLDLD